MVGIDREFQLGEWTVEPGLLRLRHGEETRSVGAKVMGVLQCLAASPGEPVSKDDLVARVWDGDAATDEALTAVVYELRRALGDDARKPRFIATIRGRGYRLLISPTALAPSLAVAPIADDSLDAKSHPALLEQDPMALGVQYVKANPASAPEAPAAFAEQRRPFLSGPRRFEGPVVVLAAMVVLAAGLVWAIKELAALGEDSLGEPSGRPSLQEPLVDASDAEIRSVAVLEMEPRGMDHSVQPSLFPRGLSEHLAIDLARSGWLEVVPAFSRALEADSEILASRQVDAVVEGSVRQEGRRLMVTVQLIAADGQLLWGGSWERPADDLSSLELELAGEISQRLRGRLGTAIGLAQSPEVDEALRLGRHFLAVDAPLEARRYFSFALERQPTLAPAHVGLADALLASAEDQPVTQRESVVDQAREAAQTALEIDADLPAAHASLGTIALVHDGDLGAAGLHFDRAGLDRGAPASSLRGYATFLSAMGRHQESIDLLRQALTRSPASVEGRLDLARALYLGERYESALDELTRIYELAPLDARVARLRSEILLVQGKHAAAVEACRQAVALAGGPEEVTELIDEVFERVGLEGVVRCLRDFEGERSTGLFEPLHLARIEAVRGDADSAMDLLRLAEDQDAPGLVWLGVDPAFASLRDLEIFEDLLASRRSMT